LFDVAYEDIAVTVHPQSIVHSMVEFVDGSTIAQASPPDMRLPISLGLDWPNRVSGVGKPLDWTTAQSWTFEPLDDEAFPAVSLAKKVGRAGGTYPAVFNAANEQAVLAFHDGRVGYLDILDTVDQVVEEHTEVDTLTLESLAAVEQDARRAADAVIARRSARA
jgi:1-deoxy-D-xylulose-5-phosphate reductoisomerase